MPQSRATERRRRCLVCYLLHGGRTELVAGGEQQAAPVGSTITHSAESGALANGA